MSRRTFPCFASTLACTLFVLSSAAAADERGWYATAALGGADYRMDLDSQFRAACGTRCGVYSADLTSSSSAAYRLGGGYRLNSWLALELAYVDLGRAKSYYDLLTEQNVRARIDGKYQVDGLQALLVGSWPVNDSLSVFGKLGLFQSRLRYSETGRVQISYGPHAFTAPNDNATQASFGLGVEYRINPHWSARLDWDRYPGIGRTVAFADTDNGRFDSVNSYLIGINYRY